MRLPLQGERLNERDEQALWKETLALWQSRNTSAAMSVEGTLAFNARIAYKWPICAQRAKRLPLRRGTRRIDYSTFKSICHDKGNGNKTVSCSERGVAT